MRNVTSIYHRQPDFQCYGRGQEIITIYSLKQIPSRLLDKTEFFFFNYYYYMKKNQIIFATVYTNK